MHTPGYLKKGDRIALLSPSRAISEQQTDIAKQVFTSWGLEVVEGKHTYSKHNQFAGTDEERAGDFQQMLDDSDIRAIICNRGGYGAVRIIDKLDFSKFEEYPKWIVGYSDITVFHSHIQRNFNIETIHSVMSVNINVQNANNPSLSSLKNALFGDKIEYHLPQKEGQREGRTTGILTGGNLSLLISLLGSKSDVDTSGKILFIEDLDEYLYHIDRMMMALKRAGKLVHLAGLIVGGMSKMRDNEVPFGKTAEEIIMDVVSEYDYPVYVGFPAGHTDDNRALILGRNVSMKVGEEFVLTM